MKENVILVLILLFCTSLICSFFSCSTTFTYPKDLVIEIGSGGGFTGLWSGYSLLADGAVISWKGKKQGDNPKEYQKLNEEKVQKIWNLIESSKAFEIKYQEPGNLSKSLRISAGGKQNFILFDDSAGELKVSEYAKIYESIYQILEIKEN